MRTHKVHTGNGLETRLQHPFLSQNEEELRELAARSRLLPTQADVHIVVVDKRSLVAECMASCLTVILESHVTTHRSLEAWLTSSQTPAASLIVHCSPNGPGGESERERSLLNHLSERLPIVIVSDAEDVDQIMAAIDRGARGYIPTNLPLNVVVEAIRLVRAGGVYVPANSFLAARRTGEAPAPQQKQGTPLFTVRQTAVVQALCKGKANKLIAHELNMRESTVKVHVRNIMKKLSAKNRTEVALMASSLEF